MNWTTLDQVWQTPTFPTWLMLAAAGFLAVVLFVTLLRSERSIANGVLAVITLLAVGVAAIAALRVSSPDSEGRDVRAATAAPVGSSLAALACIDDLAGDVVGAGCEKMLFGSADAVAAAVSYAAAQITRLTSYGDVAAANRVMTPDLQALRRAIERDRYGLSAYVLTARDRCTPSECAAYQSLTDHSQIAANMEEKVYEGLILRYAASWNAPTAPAAAGGGVALTPTMPTGKPTNAEFPTSASIPPVSIMTPEPPLTAAPRPAAPAAAAPATRPPQPPPAAKKQAAPKQRPAAPVQIAPPGASSTAPATANE